MSLPHDLVEMLSAFDDAHVRYMVVGGHAVSLHAKPRSTKDLDVWVDPAPENIAAVCDALARFGIPKELIDDLRSARDDEIVWMGKVPARIDFLRQLPALDFVDAWQRRVVAEIAGVRVTFVGIDDLIANKRAVGRAQDLRDVRALERAKAGQTKASSRPRRRP